MVGACADGWSRGSGLVAQEPLDCQPHRLRHQRWHGVANELISLGAGSGEAEPVREALDAGGFARGQASGFASGG